MQTALQKIPQSQPTKRKRAEDAIFKAQVGLAEMQRELKYRRFDQMIEADTAARIESAARASFDAETARIRDEIKRAAASLDSLGTYASPGNVEATNNRLSALSHQLTDAGRLPRHMKQAQKVAEASVRKAEDDQLGVRLRARS